MATNDKWIGTSGDWSNPANWSTGIPNSGNNAVISTTTVQTVTHNSGNDTVASILANGNVAFQMNGGSLDSLGNATFNGSYRQTGGVIQSGGTLTIALNGWLTGGASTGNTIFKIAGNIALANYTLGGGSVLNNVKTTNQTGQVTVGDNTGVNATINNQAGATYNISTNAGIGAGATSASFVNAGKLAKTSGTGTSIIGLNLTSTGTINAATGVLDFQGPTNTIGGMVSGAGAVAFDGLSNTTLQAGTTLSVGTLDLFGAAALNLGGNFTYNGTFNNNSNGTSQLNLNGHNLTLKGPASFVGNFGAATINGTGGGTLTTAGSTTIARAVIGGTATLDNTGTLAQTDQVTIGDASGSIATVINAAGGTYNLVTDAGIGTGASTASSITNAGLLEKTAGSGTSVISANVTSTGKITANSGVLEFKGLSNSIAGQVTGTTAFALGGSSNTTLQAGVALSVGTFDIFDSATVNVAGNLVYNGTLVDNSNGTNQISISAGHTLTLGGSATIIGNFGQAVITGSAGSTLRTSGTSTIARAVIGGTALLLNGGTMNETDTVQIGDASGLNASIFNGGVYNLTTNAGVTMGASAGSKFNNASLLEKTGANGTSAFNANLLSSGTILVATGILDLFGPVNTIGNQVTGAGALAFGGTSNSTIQSGTSLTVATLDVFDTATVNLAGNLSYAGTLTDNSNGSNQINLNGNTLTLTGPASFTGNFGTALITGTGGATLLTSGATSIARTTIGGTATLDNTGTLTETDQVTIGDGSGNLASLINAAGGTYNIVADAGIGHGASPANTFTNAGLLEKSAGTGSSVLSAEIVSTGTIASNTGLLDFTGPTNTLGGTLTGNGAMAFDANSETTIQAGTAVTVATLDIFNTATLDLGGNLTYRGTLNDISNGSDRINLNGHTLLASGSVSVIGNFGQAVITGTTGSVFQINSANATIARATIGGSTQLLIGGTVNETDTVTLGDTSGVPAVIFNGGTYNLTDDAGVNFGVSAALARMNNTKLFEKIGGTGTSFVNASFTNNGTITVTTGTIAFTGGFTNNGVINGTVTSANGTVYVSDPPAGSGQVISAGSANVSLTGGAGNDTLTVGSGNDTIAGGAGADLIRFVSGNAGGQDIINGFTAADTVQLAGYGAGEIQNALAGAQTGAGGTTITLSDHTQITFAGVTSLSAAQFTTG